MGIEFNFEELEDALVGISKKMGEDIIDEALDAGADIVLDSMNKNVPVDTGALKDSLGEIKKEGSKTNRKIHLGSTSTDRSIVERAYYQEYGNSSMNGKKWMKKSYNQSKDEAINAIGDSLAENLFK
jgi:HK97 gp10 family phage protein